MSDILFEVRDLKCYFKSGKKVVKALDGVSFDIYRGETLSIVGESGCGKTTCARTLLGVYVPTEGTVIWNGRDTTSLSRTERTAFRKENQMVFQDPYACLDPRMTVSEIIGEGMKRHFSYDRRKRQKIIQELLETVGLTAEYASRFPHELSGGQRQRIGIARALALEPGSLICDEPVAALDVSIQAQIINLLMRLQAERNLTYLMISHDLTMVRHISDRIAVMYLGVMVELSDAETLYENPLHPYTKALFSAIPQAEPESDWLKHRMPLLGEVPNPINPPSGCKFCERCPYVMERCRREAPQLREQEQGHFVACWQEGGFYGNRTENTFYS
ncbi:MAG: ABC transporter ATP-binding protein [Lachnospiraceae bacterium]|nr:ABC transporter ATP-binding protein [Lachnospiraceae bacterium]